MKIEEEGELCAGGGGGGIRENKEKETEETQTSDQPTSPRRPLSPSPVSVGKSDRRSAHSGSLHTTSYTNWDSDQRKSCSSAAKSARQDTSTADRGEGTDGVIRRDRNPGEGW